MAEIKSSLLNSASFKYVKNSLLNVASVDGKIKERVNILEYINDSSDSDDDEFFYEMLEFVRFLYPDTDAVAYTTPDKIICMNAPNETIGDSLRKWEFIYDHECLHQLWDTFGVANDIKKEKGSYDHFLLNVASDCVINDYLYYYRKKDRPNDLITPEYIHDTYGVDYDRKKDTQYTLYMKLLKIKEEQQKLFDKFMNDPIIKQALDDMDNKNQQGQQGQGQSQGQNGQGQSQGQSQSGQGDGNKNQSNNSSSSSSSNSNIDDMSADEAAADAQKSASDAQSIADKAQNKAEKSGKSEDKDAADKAQEAADKAQEAANKAQEAADKGDKKGAQAAAKEARDAANDAKEASGEKESSSSNSDIDKMSGSEAAADASKSAESAKKSASDAKDSAQKSSSDKDKGKMAERAKEAADKAEKLAKEAKEAADKGNEAKAKEKAKEARDNAKIAKDMADQASGKASQINNSQSNGGKDIGNTGVDLGGMTDTDLAELKKNGEEIIKKYQDKISGDLGKFISQCKASKECKKDGLFVGTKEKAGKGWDEKMNSCIRAYVKKMIFKKKKEMEKTYSRVKRGSGFVTPGGIIQKGKKVKKNGLTINTAFFIDTSGSMGRDIDNVFDATYYICESLKKQFKSEKVVDDIVFKLHAFNYNIHEIKFGKRVVASGGTAPFHELLDYIKRNTNDYLINVVITDGEMDFNETDINNFLKVIDGIVILIANREIYSVEKIAKNHSQKLFYITASSDFKLGKDISKK